MKKKIYRFIWKPVLLTISQINDLPDSLSKSSKSFNGLRIFNFIFSDKEQILIVESDKPIESQVESSVMSQQFTL